jgi:hypothetical protein
LTRTLTQAPVETAEQLTVSVVIPCLNEAVNIVECVAGARRVLEENDIAGEVVVADNGSDDGSAELARASGARVVHEQRRGYGNAYMAGFAAARGEYIVMGDADLTYDFNEIPRFVERLDGGDDLVMGNRMENIHAGAMPWLHRYIGNPLLSGFLNLLFRTGVRDAHCGMRAVRRSALGQMDLRSTGMEFASEMVVRASKEKLRISEFPIEYHPRGGESKLSSFSDGWRHLRFLVVHSPMHLFGLPGAALTLVGALILATAVAGLDLFGREWGVHTMIAGAMLAVLGSQVMALGAAGRAYARYAMGERDPLFDRLRRRLRLEHGLMLGGAMIVAGLISGGVVVALWIERGFGALSEERLAVVATTLAIVGTQVFFTSFLLSVLGLRRRELDEPIPPSPEVATAEARAEEATPIPVGL